MIGDTLLRIAQVRVLNLEEELSSVHPRDSRRRVMLEEALSEARRSMNFRVEMCDADHGRAG